MHTQFWLNTLNILSTSQTLNEEEQQTIKIPL